MNWKFTAADTAVLFRTGEAIARVIPFPRIGESRLESMDLEHMPTAEREAYEDWTAMRTAWFSKPHGPNEWMKDYYRGAKEKPNKS